ncbi:MAG: hypothetical protein J6W52_08185 [Bacteroidaceae bacterium]|nr:hypothetical protein [Bacteroidaceae bacterium]
MKTLKSSNALVGVLVLFTALAFASQMWAQKREGHFLAEPAFHDERYYGGEDMFQARANAFVFEGKHDEYFKWEKQMHEKRVRARKAYEKKAKKIKDEDIRDSLSEAFRNQWAPRNRPENPFPRHNYMVIIRPSFSLTCGFAVENNKLIYLGIGKTTSKKPFAKMEASATEVQQDLCQAMRSLMDNIVNSARVTDRPSNRMDGTTYNILTGPFPTHMVKSYGGGDDAEGDVCKLLEKLSEAAKNHDAAAINAQLPEIQRLNIIYSALKDS